MRMSRSEEFWGRRSMPKFTIYANVEEAPEHSPVEAWLVKWEHHIAYLSANLGCGCCIDIYNVDGSEEVIAELPEEVVVRKDWSEGS